MLQSDPKHSAGRHVCRAKLSPMDPSPSPDLLSGLQVQVPTLVAPTSPLRLLSPERLDSSAEAALKDLTRAGESLNTVRSYGAALRYWAGWFQLRYGQPFDLPVAVPAVLQFVLDHARRPASGSLVCELPPAITDALVAAGLRASSAPMSLATLEHRLSVLSKLHQVKGFPSPCHALEVRTVLSRVRKGYAQRSERPACKPALTREPLEALLQTCDNTVHGLRDRALLLFAWSSGGRRRSEVAAARMELLERVADEAYVYDLALSKTNQEGVDRESNLKPVVGRAAQALTAWLEASGVRTGHLFRRIRKGGHVGPEGLSSAAIREIVVQRTQLASLPNAFSAHSLRSGFVTEAVRRGASLPETMALSGHKSVAVFRRYYRDDPLQNGAARLLDLDELD